MSKSAKPAEKRAVLYVDVGGAEPIKLKRDATIFGREKGDIILDDSEVSSTHAQIQCIGSIYHIFDMNSTNGTFVNNERIVKAKLKDGDTITFGRTSYRFQLVDEDRVRHIATIFKGGKEKTSAESKVSLVDTLIESELRSTQSTTILLKIKYSDGASESVEFNQRVIYVGRASSFGRFEQDPEVSRKHLMIKVNELGEVFIEDQGSTNGSLLNGKKITGMHLVQPSDEIKVGSSRLHISTRKN